MSPIAGHRIRWLAVASAVLAWLTGVLLNWGGGAIHVLLVAAIALLIYELLAADPPPA